VGKKNRVVLLLAAFCLILVGALYGAAGDGWSTKVHMEQGGDQMTVESGGTISIKTGGSLENSSYTVEIVDSATNLTVLATHSGKILTNYGATASETFTLPTAVAGMVIDVVHSDTDNLKVVKSGSDTILGTSNNSLVITSGTLGGALRLVCPRALQWVEVSHEGTWTDTTVLP
jgi:hypothetical protein